MIPMGRGTPIFENIKYNIDTDGNAHVKITVMNATSYEKLSTMQINCQLNDGFKVFA